MRQSSPPLTRVGFCLHQDFQDARMNRIGGGPHPPAPSPSQSDREGVWIPAFAGMTGGGGNDGGLGAMNSAPTKNLLLSGKRGYGGSNRRYDRGGAAGDARPDGEEGSCDA